MQDPFEWPYVMRSRAILLSAFAMVVLWLNAKVRADVGFAMTVQEFVGTWPLQATVEPGATFTADLTAMKQAAERSANALEAPVTVKTGETALKVKHDADISIVNGATPLHVSVDNLAEQPAPTVNVEVTGASGASAASIGESVNGGSEFANPGLPEGTLEVLGELKSRVDSGITQRNEKIADFAGSLLLQDANMKGRLSTLADPTKMGLQTLIDTGDLFPLGQTFKLEISDTGDGAFAVTARTVRAVALVGLMFMFGCMMVRLPSKYLT